MIWFSAAKIAFALVAALIRRKNASAVALCLTYASFNLVVSVFSMDAADLGADWYLYLSVCEILFLTIVLTFQSHALKRWLILCSGACVAINLAAYYEFPTESTAIYSAYPFLVQFVSVVEVIALLRAPASPVDWRIIMIMRGYNDGRQKRGYSPIAGLLRQRAHRPWRNTKRRRSD